VTCPSGLSQSACSLLSPARFFLLCLVPDLVPDLVPPLFPLLLRAMKEFLRSSLILISHF
jgi:hypothetical protein